MSDVSIPTQKESPVRVVAVLRSVSHLSYIQSTLEMLLARGTEVQLVFDPQWSGTRSTEYVKAWERKHGVTPFRWAVRRSGRWRASLFWMREFRTYGSYLRRKDQSEFYLRRWRGYLPNRLRGHLQRRTVGRILNALLGTRLFDWIARAFEAVIPADPAIVKFLAELNPTAVLVTPANMRFSEEVEYLKAARCLGVPTALPVYSWDNLTTKGLIHCAPDLLLAWNETHAKEAKAIHGISPNRIAVTGSPFFDKWFADRNVTTSDRAEYCRKVGLDPEKPILTYLGSSANIASDETWLVSALAESFLNSEDPALSRFQFLVRPHPSNYKPFNRARFPSNVAVWPRPPFSFQDGVPETESDMKDFQLALRLAVSTIGINTSAMLEAIIEDKPCIAFLSDLYKSTQVEANHFQSLAQAGTLYTVRTNEACLALVSELLGGRDPLAPARHRFVASFVRPHGIGSPAAAFQSWAVLRLAAGTPARELSRMLGTSHPVPASLTEGTHVSPA